MKWKGQFLYFDLTVFWVAHIRKLWRRNTRKHEPSAIDWKISSKPYLFLSLFCAPGRGPSFILSEDAEKFLLSSLSWLQASVHFINKANVSPSKLALQISKMKILSPEEWRILVWYQWNLRTHFIYLLSVFSCIVLESTQ